MHGWERPWADGSIGHALLWWAALLALGGIAWAGLRRWMGDWQDAGWAVARHVGLVAPALGVWMAAHLAPVFSSAAVLAGVLASALAAWALWSSARSRRAPRPLDVPAVVGAELRFTAAFAFYLVMRGFNGDVIGLEKFTDFAFLNAAFHSSAMPPPDPWFGGRSINYYYFGQYLAAFVCKLSATPPRFGYNLALATAFAGVFQLGWALVAELAAFTGPRVRTLACATAGFWLTMGGNLHGFIYGLMRPLLVALDLAAPPAHAFLMSDATRFVGYDPPRPDKLITEFPAYSFYIGDLHAHLANLPNVLLLLCLALAWLRARAAGEAMAARMWLAGAGAILGLFVAANTWDAAIYTAFLAILLGISLAGRMPRRAPVVAFACDTVIVAGAAGFVAIWFLVGFRPPGNGFGLTHSHTSLWQWFVLYGEQTVLALAGVTALWRSRQGPEATMMVALASVGVGCAIFPEIFYLKDIYGAEYYRGNTAFKFGFQAFLLLTLCASVATALLVDKAARANWRPLPTIVALEVLLLPPLCYGWFIAGATLGVWRQRAWSLDGWRYLEQHADDARLIGWLAEHGHPGDVLVEAVGESYTYGARLSTLSGIPTVLGWPVHELLWRNLDADVETRRGAVAALYGAQTAGEAGTIASRYGVHWIVVGELERATYPHLDEAALRSTGRVSFESGQSFIVEVPAPAPARTGCRPPECLD